MIKRRDLKENKIYVLIIVGIFLIYGLPLVFSYDEFPLTDYPMYAIKTYGKSAMIVQCSPINNLKFRPFISPSRLLYFQSIFLKQHPDALKNELILRYFSRISADENSKIKFVNFRFNAEEYKSLITAGYTKREIDAHPSFQPCN